MAENKCKILIGTDYFSFSCTKKENEECVFSTDCVGPIPALDCSCECTGPKAKFDRMKQMCTAAIDIKSACTKIVTYHCSAPFMSMGNPESYCSFAKQIGHCKCFYQNKDDEFVCTNEVAQREAARRVNELQ